MQEEEMKELILYDVELAKSLDSINAALLYCFIDQINCALNQLWIPLTIEEIKDKTHLSRREQETAINTLKLNGLIETKVMTAPAKRHFKIL